MDEIALAEQKARNAICEVPHNSDEPSPVRIRCDAANLHAAARKIDHEEHDVADKAEGRPYLHSEEVDYVLAPPARNAAPMLSPTPRSTSPN